MSHPLSRRIDAVLDLDPAARALEFDGTWHTFAEVATLARRVAALAGRGRIYTLSTCRWDRFPIFPDSPGIVSRKT